MNTTAPEVLMTGANGLVGSVFVNDFSDTYRITNLDLSGTPSVDITNRAQIDAIFANSPAECVVHCAAFTDVTAAWQQTDDTNGLAYRVNVTGTENIVRSCERHHKKLVHLSTAYVFSGDQSTPYVETDPTGPVEWYGKTKLLAEELIMKSSADWTILRIDNPFRHDPFPKLDVAHRVLAKLSDHSLPPQFADASFGPTIIEDVARVLDWVLRTGTTGLFHATANESWSPYQFALQVAKKTNFDLSQIKQGSLTEYLQTAARPYPRNTALDCTKLISQLDFPLTAVQTAINQVIV
ncbi:SDR family oxidoreductase [Candidatus Woesebacteria bacterium]|nr:SDR family oxidoreductase [Candidatus Woesebacteria bacterium]